VRFRSIGLWLVTALAVLAAGAIVGCKKAAPDPFPATNAVAGWEKTGETRTFAAKDLWQYIDGDAEQYIKAGVVSTSTADYKYQGQVEAVVDIYTMGDADGARKILETGQTRDAQAIQVGDAGVEYAQSVTFRKGPYLVRIVAYESMPSTPQALKTLAQAIAGKLQ